MIHVLAADLQNGENGVGQPAPAPAAHMTSITAALPDLAHTLWGFFRSLEMPGTFKPIVARHQSG